MPYWLLAASVLPTAGTKNSSFTDNSPILGSVPLGGKGNPGPGTHILVALPALNPDLVLERKVSSDFNGVKFLA